MRYVIYWLITCIVFTVFFFMNNAQAAQVWFEVQLDEGGRNRVVLLDRDCPNPKMKGTLVAFSEFQGDVAYGCWTLVADKVHILWDRTGKISAVPFGIFTRKETE